MRRVAWISLLPITLAGFGLLAVGVTPALLAIGYLAVVTPWLVAFDVREHRLPNVLVVPGIAAGGLAVAGEWAATGRLPLVPLIAASAYAGFLLVLNLLGGMGMGDVKLAAGLGLASWNVGVAALSPVTAFLVGGLVSLVLLIAGRRGKRIAFGPFLLGGFWAAVVLQALARF
jgi:leader peptidase (prepilin peptidase) / N-methyltransferase